MYTYVYSLSGTTLLLVEGFAATRSKIGTFLYSTDWAEAARSRLLVDMNQGSDQNCKGCRGLNG